MRFAAAAVAAIALLAACGSDSSAVSELTVERAWARTTPAGATTGVVYFEITSPDDDTIVSASVPTDIASSAELHETMAAGESGHQHGGDTADTAPDATASSGEMVMEPLDEVELPAGTTVVFEPGGLHLMLIDLTDALTLDEEFTLTLTLGSGDQIDVDVVVADNVPD